MEGGLKEIIEVFGCEAQRPICSTWL